ncbi:hypothetical protein [Streptomyces sp. NPDC059957]|uniref:hypothetical protein n=1 Tax=unclassified Streptomyces TaxID=2593676 RepID=UPI003662715B
MSQAKDFTVSTFGLLIAYFLPGLAALYGIALWSPQVASIFETFLSAKSNVGLFLLVSMGALLIGLSASPIRYLFYEEWFRFGPKLGPGDFAKLSDAGKLESFRTVVDEHYRYHQFFGHMSLLALPCLAGLVRIQGSRSVNGGWAFAICFVALEVALIFGARHTFQKYVERAKVILA